jgi:hypothetical protein
MSVLGNQHGHLSSTIVGGTLFLEQVQIEAWAAAGSVVVRAAQTIALASALPPDPDFAAVNNDASGMSIGLSPFSRK